MLRNRTGKLLAVAAATLLLGSGARTYADEPVCATPPVVCAEEEPCSEDVAYPVGNFNFTLTDVANDAGAVTFTWQICQINTGGGPLNGALSHWVLDPAIDCLADGFTLGDLVVGATLDGVDVSSTITPGYDGSTGYCGVKINTGVPNKLCHTWTVTFDTSVLDDGWTLGVGCMGAVSKGGTSVGYGCAAGPICVLESDEVVECDTAFAYGAEAATCFLDDGFSRWGWTNSIAAEGTYEFDLYAGAGQCDLDKGALAGTVTVNYSGGVVSVSIDLLDGYTMDEAHLHVGSGKYPLSNKGAATVAPGQYGQIDELDGATEWTFDDVAAAGAIWVIVHAVVCTAVE